MLGTVSAFQRHRRWVCTGVWRSHLSLLWCRASYLLQGDANLLDSGDSWMGDVRGCSAVRNSSLSLAGAAWKGSAHSEWWGQLPAGSGDLGLRSACFLTGCCCPEALPSQAPPPLLHCRPQSLPGQLLLFPVQPVQPGDQRLLLLLPGPGQAHRGHIHD